MGDVLDAEKSMTVEVLAVSRILGTPSKSGLDYRGKQSAASSRVALSKKGMPSRVNREIFAEVTDGLNNVANSA